jgi:hypothetical protein
LVLLPSPALHHQSKDSSFESKGPSSTGRPSNYYSTNGCSIRSVKNKNQKQSWPKITNPITRFSSLPSPPLSHSLTESTPSPSLIQPPTYPPTHSLTHSTQLTYQPSYLPPSLSHPLSSQNTSTTIRISKLTRPLR